MIDAEEEAALQAWQAYMRKEERAMDRALDRWNHADERARERCEAAHEAAEAAHQVARAKNEKRYDLLQARLHDERDGIVAAMLEIDTLAMDPKRMGEAVGITRQQMIFIIRLTSYQEGRPLRVEEVEEEWEENQLAYEDEDGES